MSEDAFYFSSGMSSLDNILQGIRAGDNVVARVDDLEDFKPFVQPFCRWCAENGKTLVYFRFADHESLVPEDVPAKRYELDPSLGFEHFISEILDIITRYGKGVCYVFDCLSGLAVDWYTDRLLGNFFRITCPFLFRLDTVAYFVLFRNRNTSLAVNAIQSTAQVVVDIFRREDKRYILPLKVFERSSPTMYMLHSWEEGNFRPVKESPTVSEILAGVSQPWLDFSAHRRDMWTDTFIRAQEAEREMKSSGSTGHDVEMLRDRIIRMIITRDEDIYDLCREYFDLTELLSIGRRMLGTGLIGGKSVGMLLSRAILKRTDPAWKNRLEMHDSFFIGSDVFYSYVIKNGCWWKWRSIRNSENMYENAEKVRKIVRNGLFPEDVMQQFEKMLHYFGQSPIIVRSSSLLEDAYGNAFSGKYESVFCANQGSPEERMKEFLKAVRTVYASAISEEALSYRKHWGLLKSEEQMAILVQRVSGAYYNDFYFPQAAGVAYSFNPFVWNSSIDPSEGMIRLVFGLGTRAVDRHDDDYTRVAALNHPGMRPEMNYDDVRRYTQKYVDVLDLRTNRYAPKKFEEVVEASENLPLSIFADKRSAVEKTASSENEPWILTFDTLLNKTGFLADMHDMLQTVHRAYNHAVDMEFAVNFREDGDYRINVLQCRPFQGGEQMRHIARPKNIRSENILLKTSGPIIGNTDTRPIDVLIYIVPSIYGKLPIRERHRIARLLGKITSRIETGKNIMMIGPGRWGTSMPSLGVPVSFPEIMNVSALCEVVAMHEGLTPDFSFGTHFFNDLVEMNILYLGLFPEKEGYFLGEEELMKAPNIIADFVPTAEKFSHIIRVIDASAHFPSGLKIHVNSLEQEGLLFTP